MEYVSLFAEKAVLGSCLVSHDACTLVLTRLRKEDFSDEKNQIVYEAIRMLDEQSSAIEQVTVSNQLSNMKKLDYIGGEAYLLDLINVIPTVSEIEYHIAIVEERALVRRFFEKSIELKNEYETEEIESITEFIGKCEDSLVKISQSRRVSDFKKSEEIVEMVSKKLAERYKSKIKGVTGLDTGYKNVNLFTKGFQKGDYIILAARPSVGKTALGLNFIEKVAVKHGVPVGFFSLEMSDEQIIKRMLAIDSGIDSSKIELMNINEDEKDILFQSATEISKAPLYIEDTSGLSIMGIVDKARKLKNKEPNLGLIVIDYMGLITGNGKASIDNRQQEVSDISRKLKGLAREIATPILVLAQLSRGVEGRTNKRPMLSDLRESGSIEQDADQVFFIYREDYYKNQKENKDTVVEKAISESVDDTISKVELILAKNRNGQVGTLEMSFDKKDGIFYEIDKDSGSY